MRSRRIVRPGRGLADAARAARGGRGLGGRHGGVRYGFGDEGKDERASRGAWRRGPPSARAARIDVAEAHAQGVGEAEGLGLRQALRLTEVTLEFLGEVGELAEADSASRGWRWGRGPRRPRRGWRRVRRRGRRRRCGRGRTRRRRRGPRSPPPSRSARRRRRRARARRRGSWRSARGRSSTWSSRKAWRRRKPERRPQRWPAWGLGEREDLDRLPEAGDGDREAQLLEQLGVEGGAVADERGGVDVADRDASGRVWGRVYLRHGGYSGPGFPSLTQAEAPVARSAPASARSKRAARVGVSCREEIPMDWQSLVRPIRRLSMAVTAGRSVGSFDFGGEA